MCRYGFVKERIDDRECGPHRVCLGFSMRSLFDFLRHAYRLLDVCNTVSYVAPHSLQLGAPDRQLRPGRAGGDMSVFHVSPSIDVFAVHNYL